MKRLKHVATDNLASWFEDIIANKDSDATIVSLLNLSDVITSRFAEYVTNFNSSDLISISDSILDKNHPELLSCYLSEGVTLRRLKAIIRNMQDDEVKGVCQYCGIGKPRSIDHYLPLADYPEFSVLAINLLPCCVECNGKKRRYWKEEGQRGIINFYVDNIPAHQFLFGKVHFVGGVPCVKFFISNESGWVNMQLYPIIERHFKRLELIDLYNSEATDELSEMIRMFKNYINPTVPDELRSKLKSDALQLQMQFGVNYWKAVLRIALAESDMFINYLVKEINQ